MVDWVKCIPFVGTAVSGVETVQALLEGNGEKALWKLGETSFGVAMDALTLVSLGSSTIVTASVKTGIKVVGYAAVRNAAGITLVRAVGTTVTGNQAEGCFPTGGGLLVGGRGGGGGGGDRSWKKGKGDHEKEQDGDDQSSEEDDDGQSSEQELDDEGSPITKVNTDGSGRVKQLSAEIRSNHLRSEGSRKGGEYSNDVKKHVKAQDMKAGDQVGHIIGWALGGPRNYIYNYFPQHQRSNNLFYHELEQKIQNFLKEHANGRVTFRVDFYYEGTSRRPTGMDYYLGFWTDDDNLIQIDDFHWYNDGRNELSKREYRSPPSWWSVFKNSFNGK